MDIRSFFGKSKEAEASRKADDDVCTGTVPSVPPSAEKEKSPVDIDEVQEFISHFKRTAKLPLMSNGKTLTARRVTVYGKPYYWGKGDTKPITALPASFRTWVAQHGFSKCNSFLVQIYDHPKSNITWHTDLIAPLDSHEVACVSFALNKSDRHLKLADLEFRWPDKADNTKFKHGSAPLRHGTIVRFDAVKHSRKNCQHRVPKTLAPRVSVSMRVLK